MKDYYYILGLKPNANLQEIKTAYRKLSKKFHPDVNNGDPFFTERFKEIQEAYETLSNTNKRKRYNNNNYDHQTEPEREEPALPNIKTFATDKANYVINETVKITWEVLNAEKVNVNLFGNVTNSGSKTIRFKKPKDDLAITLNATNKQGNQVAETIHIAVDGYTDANPHYEFDKETNSINWSKIFIEAGILAFTILATSLIYSAIKSNVDAAFLFSKFDGKEDEILYLPTTINTLCLLIPAIFAYIIRPFGKDIKNWFTELKFEPVILTLVLFITYLLYGFIRSVPNAVFLFTTDEYWELKRDYIPATINTLLLLSPVILAYIAWPLFKSNEFLLGLKRTIKNFFIEFYVDLIKVMKILSPLFVLAFVAIYFIKKQENSNQEIIYSEGNTVAFEELQKIRLRKIYQTLPKLNDYGSQNDFNRAMLESRTNREKLYNKLPSLQKIGTFEAIESYLNSPMESLIELPFKKRFKIGDESLMNEQALIDAYDLFKDGGYNGSLDKFKSLISSNNQALQDAYSLFKNSGYNKSIDDFSALIGVEINAKLISNFKGNQLENGASPYEYYFGKSVYESNSLHSIKFKAGKTSDVIVCLAKVYDNTVIRHEYIRKGETFEMTKIPDGTYYLKSIYGNDWNPNKMIFNKQVQGAFDTDLSFSKSDDITDRFLFNKERAADGISYSTYEVTLYLVKHGNMESEKINENEFFE